MRNPILALVLSLVIDALAQSPETFKTRLAPVASDATMKTNIAGAGTATATLAGTKFTVNGTFEGLKSNATMAHIHQGTAPGVRGAKLLDLHEEELLHEVLDMMACKAAVKAGDPLTPGEIEALLARRDLVERSSNCPHGRPTALVLSRNDLDRQFGRLG